MDRVDAVYVTELLEAILRAEPGTPMAGAREEFARTHGTHGLKMLFSGERALRRQWQIPDSTGKVEVEE